MSKNFADSTVATAPSTPTAGTSLVVASGHGSKFYVGKAIIAPVNVRPSTTNSEVVNISAISTDTLTIARAQESSSARTVLVGDVIYQGITAAMLDNFRLSTTKIVTADLDNNWYPLLGGSSFPSTPGTGFGEIYGVGTGAIRPNFINSTGNVERIMTSLTSGNAIAQSGTVTTSAGGVTTVTFGTAFSSAPVVFATAVDNSIFCIAQIETVSSTAIGVDVFNLAGSRVAKTLHWIAVGSV